MTTADTLRLRDRLLAELRESPHPVSTAELAARMPWKVERSEEGCALVCHRAKPNSGVEVVECHRSWHVVQYRRTAHGYTGIYRHLRSMERQGLIRRALRQGRKRVCWTYIGSDQLIAARPGQAAGDWADNEQGADQRCHPPT
jgi:hypothetical protein